MKEQIVKLLEEILLSFGITNIAPVVDVPEDSAHGDYTTNVAMKLYGSDKRPFEKTQGKQAISEKFKTPMEFALSVVEQVKIQKSKVKGESSDHTIYKKDQKVSPLLPVFPILQAIERVEVVPPGFINIFLTEAKLISQLSEVLKEKDTFGTSKKRITNNEKRITRKILVEFAHPNTHKAFHIGHLRNITTGESIVRLLESQGNTVIRANYQGDVGMHIAKALYALLRLSPYKDDVMKHLEGDRQAKARHDSFQVSQEKALERVDFLGKAYAAGSKAFEENPKVVEDIKDINYLIYAAVQRFNKELGIEPSSTDYMQFVHGRGVEVDKVYELWKETRQWSLEYFDSIYKRVGSRYDRLYFESECLVGVDLAKDAVKRGVLKESDGAVVFDGKPHGIDTRVFVNSLGLPTYEGKELSLATKETTEFGKVDQIIHVVGPEQASFFKTTFKAEELLGIVGPNVQHHLVYGWVRLKHGKMSSRSGNVVLGEWLLDEAEKEIYSILQKTTSKESSPISSQLPRSPLSSVQKEEIAQKAAVAAVKYAFLKVGTTSEISFDLKESVNFQGDSGPYLQYTYARCQSVLRKAKKQKSKKAESFPFTLDASRFAFNPEERAVARLLLYFPDIVADAASNFAPNTLCTYLFQLAQAFNLFYAKHPILGSKKQEARSKKHNGTDGSSLSLIAYRLSLTSATAQVIHNGLYLLGIETLEKM